jgi:DNA polymerase-4
VRERKIIHVDMDAFYASVEQLDHPEYRGKPIVVGGSPQSRSVVCTASYEARKFGVRSAIPCSMAARLCPQAIFVEPRFERYSEVSDQVHKVFGEFSSRIESMGLDEAYLDVTDNPAALPSATETARRIRARIFETTKLTASAGVAPNKMLAKIASDLHKPNGLTVIKPSQVTEVLRTLALRKLPGVGPATEKRLNSIGIHNVADLMQARASLLEEELGKTGLWLYELAQGHDDREVETEWERKSVGCEDTFSIDLLELEDLRGVLAQLADRCAERMSSEELQGRTVTLKVKYDDFTQITRSHSLDSPTSDARVFREVAQNLLKVTEAGRRPVRLLGISVSQFGMRATEEGPVQLEFDFPRIRGF